MKLPKISVIGLGFVGLSLAVVNAKKGFDTIAIDKDNQKIERLEGGRQYFYEPKLESYLKQSLKTKKIRFSNNLQDLYRTDITFLTVGTPSNSTGQIDLSYIKKACKQLASALKRKKTKHLLVIKSTVLPTTTSYVIKPIFKNLKNIHIVVNPEFLREGNAIKDLEDPHLIVIGSEKEEDGKILEKYYKSFYKKCPEILHTDFNTAEMIKYTNNVFLATKISFINSIANLCQKIPLTDVNKISYAIGKDPRIGPQFLNAGPGFGGSCLPKDLSAFVKFSSKYSNSGNLFKTVQQINYSQPLEIMKLLKEMNLVKPNKTIGILGLAFKKNTDDIREAISIKVVKRLLNKKLKIKVHDPMALDNFKKIFGEKINYCKTSLECIRGANCCVVLTEWDEYRDLNQEVFLKNMKEPNLIDARRILDPERLSKLNFKAIGKGPNLSKIH